MIVFCYYLFSCMCKKGILVLCLRVLCTTVIQAILHIWEAACHRTHALFSLHIYCTRHILLILHLMLKLALASIQSRCVFLYHARSYKVTCTSAFDYTGYGLDEALGTSQLLYLTLFTLILEMEVRFSILLLQYILIYYFISSPACIYTGTSGSIRYIPIFLIFVLGLCLGCLSFFLPHAPFWIVHLNFLCIVLCKGCGLAWFIISYRFYTFVISPNSVDIYIYIHPWKGAFLSKKKNACFDSVHQLHDIPPRVGKRKGLGNSATASTLFQGSTWK